MKMESKTSSQVEIRILQIVLLIYFVMIPIRTWIFGDDFEVFWFAARDLFAGSRIYSVESYGNMVFKYPPWTLPVFIPFAALPLSTAKIIWGWVQSFSLVFVVRWLGRRGARTGVVTVLLVLFSGVILVHANVGQITLPLLAISLGTESVYTQHERGWRFSLLSWTLGSKIFSAFPLLGLHWRNRLTLRAVLRTTALLILLSLPVAWLSYRLNLHLLMREWIDALFSGTQGIHARKIGFTTRECQGLPSFILRVFQLNEENRTHLLLSILGPAAVLFTGWKISTKSLSRSDQWLALLALTPLIQPLAWFHFFWMVFPVGVFAIDRALSARNRIALFVGSVGLVLVAAVTQKTLGSLGYAMEMASVKSWGTLICLGSFIMTAPRTAREPRDA